MRTIRWLAACLPVLVLVACGSGGGGGGSGNSTTFKGAATGGSGNMYTVVMTVQTVSFSPPAPLFPTASLQAASVSATVTLKHTVTGATYTLQGTWDENNNTLSVSGNGTTMDGGYNVPSNQIGGQVNWANGDIDEWTGLKGGAGTIYCGVWAPAGVGNTFAFVITASLARGYGDVFGTPVDGTVSGNTVSFTTGGLPGTGTFGAGGITGTVNGNAFTGNVCG